MHTHRATHPCSVQAIENAVQFLCFGLYVVAVFYFVVFLVCVFFRLFVVVVLFCFCFICGGCFVVGFFVVVFHLKVGSSCRLH